MAQQFRAGVMSHVDGEYKTYRSSVYQGAQAAEVQNIAANFHDADAVRTSIDNLKYLGDATMATTILDRLMHRCAMLEFEGKSYRLKEAASRIAVTPV